MKKMIAMLLCALMLMSLIPMNALAEDDNAWICTDCYIWVSGESCPQCGKTRAVAQMSANECLLTFQIDFQKNKFFSKYDVEIIVNGNRAFFLEHGSSLDGSVIVPKGKCEVVFRYVSSPSADLRFSLNLTGNTTFFADIVTHFYGLEMLNVTCSAFQGNQQLGLMESGTRNGARMMIRDVTRSRGNGMYTPADGYVFVWVEFEVSNTTNSKLNLRPQDEFSVYCDGYTVQPSTRSASAAPMGFPTSLGSGDKMKAMLCFELPTNWQELRIVYGNEDIAYDRLIYVVTNK
ncbi:MAG: DUF4352 domain-containing protein [Clostridia bacterium]|nr:DUF4352 domain-containing protein [Clostridia bacterium]